jgi:hypothetical protein
MSATPRPMSRARFILKGGEALKVCARLGLDPATAEENVRALVEALKDELPMDAAGECVWCGLGSVPRNFIHPDLVWGGDPNCLNHPRYARALAALAAWKEASDGKGT